MVNLSRGVEEDASFATLAARQALEAVSRYRAVLAAELVASLRCLRMQGARPPALHDALDYLDERDGGISEMSDRDLTSDLLLGEELVDALPDHVAAVQRAGGGTSDKAADAHLVVEEQAGRTRPRSYGAARWLRSERSVVSRNHLPESYARRDNY